MELLQFLDHACLRYQGHDAVARREQARTWLEAEPSLGTHTMWGAAAVGDRDAVRRHLDAGVSVNAAGPEGWVPLLHACYSRVSVEPGDAMGVVEDLLDAGADPNAGFVAWGSEFTALTGVMGEGERGPEALPAHPHAEALVDLLLARGADPNDSQGMYNTMLRPATHWLRRLLAAGLGPNAPLRWTMPGAPTTLDFLLAHAASKGDLERLELLLAHGADPSCVDPYSGRRALTVARLDGRVEAVSRLRAAGAVDEALRPGEALRAELALGGSPAGVPAEVAADELADLVRWAAGGGRIEVLRWLLGHGAPADATDDHGTTALHLAVSRDDADLLRLLVEHGASVGAVETRFGATPLDWARHQGKPKAVAYLLTC